MEFYRRSELIKVLLACFKAIPSGIHEELLRWPTSNMLRRYQLDFNAYASISEKYVWIYYVYNFIGC